MGASRLPFVFFPAADEMNIELFSHSKYKNSGQPGDDVALIIPDTVYAVFDGATDPTGATYGGQSGGRIAARAGARTIAAMATDDRLGELEPLEVFQSISDAVLAEAKHHDATHPPSTTAAVVYDAGTHFRILLAGDTGVRVNGETLYQHHKLIDSVSNSARISVFKLISARLDCLDAAEMQTRAVIFDGLDASVQNGQLTRTEADDIIDRAACAIGHPDAAAVRAFLSGGIRFQPSFANNCDSMLGFASLNGGKVIADGTRDLIIEKATTRSLEIFSDGYLTQPSAITIAAWEAEFDRVEQVDFHKIEGHPSVKGSTSTEYCDDRTILSIAF